jgi:hypothetical protein
VGKPLFLDKKWPKVKNTSMLSRRSVRAIARASVTKGVVLRFLFFGRGCVHTGRTIVSRLIAMHWRRATLHLANTQTDVGLCLPSVPDEISPSAGPE